MLEQRFESRGARAGDWVLGVRGWGLGLGPGKLRREVGDKSPSGGAPALGNVSARRERRGYGRGGRAGVVRRREGRLWRASLLRNL